MNDACVVNNSLLVTEEGIVFGFVKILLKLI